MGNIINLFIKNETKLINHFAYVLIAIRLSYPA